MRASDNPGPPGIGKEAQEKRANRGGSGYGEVKGLDPGPNEDQGGNDRREVQGTATGSKV